MSNLEFIKDCQEKVFSGERISVEDARKLFNVPNEDLKELKEEGIEAEIIHWIKDNTN